MEAVKINNMYIPETCMNCPLATLDSYGYRICFVTEVNVTNNYWDRNDRCPMEKVEE